MMPQKRVAEAEATTTKRQPRPCFACVVYDWACGINIKEYSHCMCWVHRLCVPVMWEQLLGQIFWIGTVCYAEGLWRIRRHGPVIAHCTDSEDFPLPDFLTNESHSDDADEHEHNHGCSFILLASAAGEDGVVCLQTVTNGSVDYCWHFPIFVLMSPLVL